MNFNNFTIKAQESVQKSIDLARANNQQIIEPTHLLKGLIMVGEDIANFLFQKMGVNVAQLQLSIDKEIESFPRVSGGDPTLSRELNSVFQKANDIASKMGDQFVSIEHLLLAIINEKNSASQILKSLGASPKMLEAAIMELRKGEKVTSQSAEETYQALSKYSINLNDANWS